jgi:ABC-2 type transport system permease protein
MRKLGQVYGALLRANWGLVMEYRAQALLWIISFLFPLIMMNVWLAVVDEAGPLTGWGQADFVSYYVGVALMNYITVAWVTWDWDEDIRTGSLSVKLLKPVDPVHHLVTQELSWKFFTIVFLLPVIAAVAWASPLVSYPLTPLSLIACALAAITGFLINFLMNSMFGMISFWSTQSSNLEQLWSGGGMFLSGWIAPLALFPPTLQTLAVILPFRYTLSFPVEILMGRLTGPEIGWGFAASGIWILIFFILYRLLWRLGIKRYEAVGA